MATTSTTAPSDEKREWLRGVLQRHGPALRRYAARLTGDVTLADAVVQTTLRKLMAATPQPAEDKLAEWLFRVGRNSAVDSNRGRRGPGSGSGSEAGSPAGDADDAPAPKGGAKSPASKTGGDPLLIALNKLNQVQQEVLRLKFQHGMNYREIGGILNLTVPNVGILIHGAMKQLRSNPQLREQIARL